MSNPDDENNKLVILYRVNDDIILAGMSAAKFGIPFKLPGWLSERIVSQQIEPSTHAFLNVDWKFIQLPECLICQFYLIWHVTVPFSV